jgi:hypothetical protein
MYRPAERESNEAIPISEFLYRKRLLTDTLVSFKYIPGTVVYAGYGSVHERLRWETNSYVRGDEFLQTRQGVFFKASYLSRL